MVVNASSTVGGNQFSWRETFHDLRTGKRKGTECNFTLILLASCFLILFEAVKCIVIFAGEMHFLPRRLGVVEYVSLDIIGSTYSQDCIFHFF